jgi:hypothetical protein
MSRLLTGVAVIAICLSLLAGRAASARPQAQSKAPTAWVGITGWGNVTLGKGFVEHRTVRCTAASCPSARYPIHARRIVMIARPYKGWKFTGWHGACKDMTPKCVARKRNARVGATFIPVDPGWTSDHPLGIGVTTTIGDGYRVRVNSVLPNPQLSPAAPSGKAYFAVNVTLAYTGGGEGNVGSLVWFAVTNDGGGQFGPTHSITAAGDPPYATPEPTLDYQDPLEPGHSTTGYVCWTVGAGEVSHINELAVQRSAPPFRATWFTLR